MNRAIRLAVMLSAIATSPARADELKTIATFTKGQVSLSQGGTPIKWQLKAGEIESMSMKIGGKPIEVVSYHLSYWEDGNPRSTNSNRVEITLMNMTGPGKYTKDNVMVFSVMSKQGTSTHRSSKGTNCAFELTKADAKGIAGTANCKGEFVDFNGKAGAPKVEGVKFDAAP